MKVSVSYVCEPGHSVGGKLSSKGRCGAEGASKVVVSKGESPLGYEQLQLFRQSSHLGLLYGWSVVSYGHHKEQAHITW